MENFSKFIDSYLLLNTKQNPHKFVIDESVAYENVKSFSPEFSFKVFKFEGLYINFPITKPTRRRRQRMYFKLGFQHSYIVKKGPIWQKYIDSELLLYSERTKKQDELKFLANGKNSPQIHSKADAPLPRALLANEIREVNSLERKKCSSELVSAKDFHMPRLIDETSQGNRTSNAMHVGKSLVKISNDGFIWNSSCKPLLKTVEVHKGKQFVRMVPASFPVRIDAVLDSREKLTDERCNNQVIVKNTTLNFCIDDTKNRPPLTDSRVMSESILPCFFNSLLNKDRRKIYKRFSDSSRLISNRVGSKNSSSEIYRICFLPEEGDIKVPNVWNNASEELAEDREFSLKSDTTSFSTCDQVENSKVNFPDSSAAKGNGRISFKSGFSWISTKNESKKEREIITSIYDGLLNCQRVLNNLENAYEKVKKEFLTVLFNCKRIEPKDIVTSELTLLTNYICNYPNPPRKESFNILATSNTPNSHEMKISGLQNFQADYLSTFQHNERYTSQLNDTCERTFQEDTSHSTNLKLKNNYSSVNEYDSTSISNECDDQFLTLPSEESLILFNDILLRLQNNYEIVRKYAYSWLISKDTYQSIAGNTNCDTLETVADKWSSITNGNCLMKFKGRNSYTIDRKYSSCTSSDSTSSFSLHSDMETLEYSSMARSESELDDSESSLEGSFKQYNRADSRESMTSTDSDHSDEIPRFSLPSHSRRRNCSRFHFSRKIDFVDKVSSKEWSWKSGDKEFTVKCAQRERRLQAQDDVSVPEDLLRFNAQDDIGVPENLMRDFGGLAFLNANVTKMA